MRPRALILGGTRFVGRCLLERLLALGYSVDVLNRGVTAPAGSLPAGAVHLRADRADHDEVRARLAGREYDAVFDTSAYRPGDVAAATRALTGSAGHYALVSTCVVYTRLWTPGPGHLDEAPEPIGEDEDTVDPYFGDGDIVLHYAGAKRACETVLMEQDGIPATVLRPCGIYGRYDDWYRHDYFFDRIAAGRPVLVPDSHTGRRVHLTSVDGLTDACVLAAGRSGHDNLVANVADEDVLGCGEMARECARAAGVEPDVVVYPSALAEDIEADPRARFPFGDEPGFRLDCTRAAKELGWRAPPFATGTAALHADHAERRAAGRLADPDFGFDDAVLARLAVR